MPKDWNPGQPLPRIPTILPGDQLPVIIPGVVGGGSWYLGGENGTPVVTPPGGAHPYDALGPNVNWA